MIQNHIKSLQIKNRVKKCTYLLVLFCTIVTVFLLAFELKSADKKHINKIKASYNLSGHFYKKNLLNPFGEQTSINKLDYYKFFQLRYAQSKPPCDRTDFNSIMLSGNGDKCGAGLLKLNGLYGANQEAVDYVDLYYSKDNTTYTKVTTNTFNDDNREDALHFTLFHPGYYRAVITFTDKLNCTPPKNLNTDVNIKVNDNQYLVEKAYKTTVEQNGKMINPRIVLKNGSPVPSEICDMTGLTLEARLNLKARLEKYFKWYLDNVKVLEGYDKDTFMLPEHIDPGKLGNVHTIKVTALVGKDIKDGQCINAYIPSDEVTIKVTQLPRVNLTVSDTLIDQNGTKEYYFKGDEGTFVLKATDADGQNFNKYSWHNDKLNQEVSTASTYTVNASDLKDGDSYTVKASYTDSSHNSCTGTAKVIFKQAYKYSPTFDIKGVKINNDTAYFCKEVPKNTVINLVDQNMSNGKTAWQIILDDDPNAKIQWIVGMKDLGTPQQLDKTANTSPDIQPTINKIGQSGPYSIRINGHNLKHIYIDTNSQAYKGILIDTIVVKEPKIKDHNNGDEITICKGSKTPDTSIIIENKDPNYSVEWAINGAVQENNTTDTLTIKPQNLKIGKYTISARFKTTQNSTVCYSDPVNIIVNVYDEPSAVIAYKNFSGALNKITQNQYVCKDPNKDFTLYAKETDSLLDVPAGSIISWFKSVDTLHFTAIGEGKDTIVLKKTTQGINTIAYYRYVITHPADKGGCAATSPMVTVVNFKPSIQIDNSKPISCDNAAIKLTAVAKNANGTDIIEENSATWQYKATEADKWETVDSDNNKYSATKTGYYRVLASSYLMGKVPVNECAPSDPIYLIIQDTIKPKLSTDRTEICNEAPATLIVYDGHYKNDKRYPDNFTYKWYKDKTLIPDVTSYQYKTNKPGTYTVEVIDTATSCIGTTNPIILSELALNADFNTNKGSDKFICMDANSQDTITLTAVEQNAETYEWEVELPGNNDLIINSDRDSQVANYKNLKKIDLADFIGKKYPNEKNISGVYKITLKVGKKGCTQQVKKSITILYKTPITYTIKKSNQDIIIEKQGVYNICKNDTVTVSTNINKYSLKSGLKVKYLWYKNDNIIKTDITDKESILIITETGKYKLEVQLLDPQNEKQFCTIIGKEFTIKQSEVSADFNILNNLCIDADGKVKLSAIQKNNKSYHWAELINHSHIDLNNESYADIEVKLAVGKHVIQLTVTDENGCTDIVKKTITVTEKPQISIRADKTIICGNANSTLTAEVKGNVKAHIFNWLKYDDKNKNWIIIKTTDSNTFVVTEAGKYSVRVETIEGCKNISNTIEIQKSVIKASISTDKVTSCMDLDKEITLKAEVQEGDIIEYSWKNLSINNSVLGIGEQISTKLKNGENRIQLTLTDKLKCITVIDTTINASYKPDPKIFVQSENKNICNDKQVILKVKEPNKANAIYKSYQWQVKDVNNKWVDIHEATRDTFATGGSGTFRVIVTNSDNCKNASNSIDVKKETVTAKFTPEQDSFCFESLSTASINLQAMQEDADSYEWQVRTGDTVTHTYNGKGRDYGLDITKSGEYTITLTVKKNDCSVQAIRRIIVVAKPKIIYEYSKSILCPEQNDSLTIKTKIDYNLPVKYRWYRNNNLLQESSNTLVVKQEGTYQLKLELLDPRDSKTVICVAEGREVIIDRSHLNANFEVQNNECVNQDSADIKLIANYDNADSYNWIIKNTANSKEIKLTGKTQTKNLPIGSYTITLITKSQGCQSEKTKNIKITEKPQVKLKSSKSDNKLCTNSTITLTVESKNGHNPKYKIYKWYKYNINAWEQIENANTAVYEVKSEGSYKVEVVDENDCKGETNVIEIKKSSVDASFIVTPNNLTCLENAKHITLTANSIDSTNTYKWTNLTTGKVISTNSIVEAQLPEGKNDIKLEVINAYGCKEETTQTLNISYKPHPKIDIKHGRKAEICILIDGFGNIYTRSIVLVANKSYASESDYIKYKWQVKVREQWYDLHVNTKEYIVDKSATYRVVVTNKFNCEAISDELEVKETTIHMDFRNNVNNETEPIIDRNVDPILLCVDKNQKIKFTANENEANSYRWVITGDYHLPQTHQFKETTIDANIQGKLDVQLIMQKKSCLIDRPIKTYYVVFKPIVTIKEANDKNHLCGKDDSVRLIAEIADKIPDGWLREYKWYKKIDSEHSELVGKDSTLEVKVQGEYYVEATTVIKYSGGKKEYRCSSTSNTIKIGKKEVVATHNYTNKTEIKCLDVTLGLTSLDLRADYISETAKYKWEVKNEATNRTYTSTARTYKYDILNEGKYVIKLSVTDEDCTITSEQAIVISIQPPNFHLTDEQGKGIYCAYDTVYLRADQESTISPILELEYDWLYSDKDNVPKNQWKHIAVTKENRLLVEKTGYYRLQVKTKYGCIYETNLSVYIIKHTEVVYPNISVESCLNDNEELVIHNTTNYNGIEPQECVWNFGDGDSDYSNCSNTISHKYAQPGKYKITLTIKLRDECKFTKEFNIDYKQNYKPKAKIVIENKKDKYCQTYNIIFVDKSERKTNNYSAKWKVENQGIDVTSEVAQITADTLILTPLRSVDKDTKYIITLTAQNNISEKNSCQTSATKEVWVDAQPLIEFDDIEKEVCKDHDVIKLNGKYHYNGNKRISEHYEYSKQGENTRHKLDGYNLYPSKLGAGIFTIYYVVQVNDSNGVKPVCLEELSKVITIHDFKIPKIEIKSDHKLNKVCEGTDVLLEATEDFDNYQWYRNSELIPHATSKTLQVKKTGKYSLVVDYKFCGEKTSNFIDIVISETPLAKFAIPEELDCKDKKIKFINQSSSTSPIIKYEWDFGDRYTSNEENPIHSYVNEGTYEVSLTVTNSAGCSSTTKQLLFYRKIKPEIDFKIIASCITSPIEAYGEINTLTGKIKSVEWIVYSAGQNIKEAVVPSSNPNFKYLIPIEYEGTNLELEMKVTTDEGCVSIKRQSIKLKNAPKINIGFKKLILCSHTGYIDLKEKATPRVGGSWYLLKPGQSYNEKEIIENGLLDISSLRPATYKIILEYKDSATACIANSEAEVDIIEEPYVKIIVKGNNNNKTHADTTEINTCEGDDITLQATINIKADIKDIHYQWYKDGSSIKGQTGNEIHIKEEGTYEVHALVKNMTRCNAEAKIKINMYPKYHVVIDPKPIILCRSAEPIKLTFGSITPIPSEEVGAGHYYLSNNGAKGQEITLFDPSKYSGKVDIIYEFVSFNGCKDSKIKTIIVNSPTGKVQEELEVKEGESATIENSLSFGDGVTTTFKWIPKTYLDSDTISSPVVTPEKDMLYNLKISDGKGCMYTYKVQVRVIPNLHVPNVIVPNSGSSSNSTLHIRGIEKYPRAILTILDRFGQKVWESDPGYPTPWDGTNKNGEPLEIGTYYYILKPNKAATASPNIDSPEGSSSDIKPLDDLTGYIEIIH